MRDLRASPDDRAKLTAFIECGVEAMQDISDIRNALNEAIKVIAGELQVKPAVLRKALQLAFKKNIADEKGTMVSIGNILDLTGRS